MFNLKATEGRLIIKVIEKEKKTSSGIYLAKESNPDVHKGIVVSVGVYAKDTKQEFHEGQIVYWQNYVGVDYVDGKDKYLICNQNNIIATEG